MFCREILKIFKDFFVIVILWHNDADYYQDPRTMTKKKHSLNEFCLILFVFLLFSVLTVSGQTTKPKDVRFYLQQAAKAHKEKNYSDYLANIQAAVELRPGQATYLYNLASAYALNGRKAEALGLLERIASMGLIYPAQTDEDFVSLRDSEPFKAVVRKFEANKNPISHSTTAFTVPQKGLITESVAYDPQTKTFFLSSIYRRKIVRLDEKGMVTDFSASGDGLWSVMGMKVDARRRHLWVCTAAHPQMLDYRAEENGSSAVVKYDLETGKILKKYQLPNEPKRHWFGDLVIAENGDVFISDSLNPSVYVIPRLKDELELFLESDSFVSPQGLDFSADEKTLFLADYSKGLFSVDRKTKKVTPLLSSDSTTLGIDGLYFYRGSLIAIQNGTRPHRVVRMKLGKDLSRIEKFETLEANNTLFDEPTLGVIVKDTFFYIANSQWGAISQKGELAPDEKLRQPVVLKIKL
jgi:tetratricopeptide (TPR) repeat protein